MTTRTVAFAGVLLIVLIMSSACGGGGSSDAPGDSEAGRTDGSSASASEEDPLAVAEQGLLTLEDLPEDWRIGPEGTIQGGDLDLPDDCEAYVEFDDPPGAMAQAESPGFFGLGGQGTQSSVTVFRDVFSARQPFIFFSDNLGRCREALEEAVTEDLIDVVRRRILEQPVGHVGLANTGLDVSGSGQGAAEGAGDPAQTQSGQGEQLGLVATSVDELFFPQFGDDVIAFRVHATVEIGESGSLEAYADFLAMRVGLVVGTLTRTTALEARERPDTGEKMRLAGLLEERLTSANALLD